MKLKGKLTIGRVNCGYPEKDYIRVEINDANSSITFIVAEVSLADFAQAITGLACVPMSFEAQGLDKVGKKLQLKRINVVLPSSDHEQIEAVVAEHEVEGWLGDVSDTKNHHNIFYSQGVRSPIAKVSYRRWVEPGGPLDILGNEENEI